jgi:PAS domain S-box-containing protein
MDDHSTRPPAAEAPVSNPVPTVEPARPATTPAARPSRPPTRTGLILVAALVLCVACGTALAATGAGPAAVITGCTLILAAFGLVTARTTGRLVGAVAVAEQEATSSHNQLQKLIDNTSAVIYMKRIDNGQYLLVNREWERLFGVRRESVVNLTDHGVFPPEVADQLRGNDLGVAQAGRTVQYEETADSEDGLRTYVSVKFPVRDGAGNPYAVCGISTDITEIKRAEEQVRDLNAHLENRVRERTAELEASTKELDAFAYSVSHDLRAPLRSLHGFSAVLLDDYSDVLDEEGRDYLNRIMHNVQRMGRMIDDLLNLSRATRVDLTREDVDLGAIATDILAELADEDPAREVTTTVEDGLHAYGDPHLIRLALHNLLANAWKFTAFREPAHIEVGKTTSNGHDCFFVRDNGAGFDMRYADKLFTAFQRLHPVAEFEGTGIGLATVARVIRRHGGEITTYAEPDNGATFTFTLTGPIGALP